MNDGFNPAYLFLLIPVFFMGMWMLVSFILAHVSGWVRMAERFPAAGVPDGKKLRMLSAKIGWVNFYNCLTVIASTGGLYLSRLFLFRFQMPSVLTPWRELRDIKGRQFLWMHLVSFDGGAAAITRIKLPERAVEGVKEFEAVAGFTNVPSLDSLRR